MEENLRKAIDDFIDFYNKSNIKKEEDELDKEIENDKDLSKIIKEGQISLGSYLKNKNDISAMKSLASAKKNYYSNEKVKRRFELYKEIKSVLSIIENGLIDNTKNIYDNF